MKTFFTTIILALVTLGSMNAQKFGHLNSNLIITSMPEVKAADTELESYQKILIQKGQAMMKEYEGLYTAYAEKANKGELSQLQMQQEETALAGKQQAIQQYEVEVQQLIATKKQEVYQPILDKIQVAINEIGKENGYTMIFDSSSMGMVFSNDTEDVMALVKAKLGVQ